MSVKSETYFPVLTPVFSLKLISSDLGIVLTKKKLFQVQ